MTKHQKWFQSWFDTSYYHILYKQRDRTEAQGFIKNLVRYLEINQRQSILDLACGKGRHSIFLNALGFRVQGIDLSKKSIAEASKSANERLRFAVHDMRIPLESKFDVVLNLFTSFGYFDSIEDNYRVLETIKNALCDGGFGVIDFMNSPYVLHNLLPSNTTEIDGIRFDIKRNYSDGIITKSIAVTDGNSVLHYKERVRAFDLHDFIHMLSEVNLNFVECFGSYTLEPYDPETSKRLILIFKNNA